MRTHTQTHKGSINKTPSSIQVEGDKLYDSNKLLSRTSYNKSINRYIQEKIKDIDDTQPSMNSIDLLTNTNQNTNTNTNNPNGEKRFSIDISGTQYNYANNNSNSNTSNTRYSPSMKSIKSSKSFNENKVLKKYIESKSKKPYDMYDLKASPIHKPREGEIDDSINFNTENENGNLGSLTNSLSVSSSANSKMKVKKLQKNLKNKSCGNASMFNTSNTFNNTNYTSNTNTNLRNSTNTISNSNLRNSANTITNTITNTYPSNAYSPINIKSKSKTKRSDKSTTSNYSKSKSNSNSKPTKKAITTNHTNHTNHTHHTPHTQT